MKFIAACGPTHVLNHDFRMMKTMGIKYYLFSYFYHLQRVKQDYPTMRSWFEKLKSLRPDAEFFLDCGAFTAHTLDIEIDLDQYTRDVLDCQHVFRWVAALDVIPGKWGEVASEAESADATERGWANFQTMLRRGVDPEKIVPCFHYGEPLPTFERIVQSQVPHMAVSPRSDLPPAQSADWLRWLHQAAIDISGHPRSLYHGYGIGSAKVMESFPYDTVDSASFLLLGAYGKIALLGENGDLLSIPVSYESQAEETRTDHFMVLSPEEQAYIKGFVEARGFEFEELMRDFHARQCYNAVVMVDMVDKIKVNPPAVNSFFEDYY